MKKLLTLLLLVPAFLFAQEEVEATYIEAFGTVAELELESSANGRGAVLLVRTEVEPSIYDSQIIAQQILPVADGFKIKSRKKISAGNNRAHTFDLAFDERSGKFLAVWSEELLVNGKSLSSVFTHLFATNGNPIRDSKVLFIDTDSDFYAPGILALENANSQDTYKLLYTKRDNANTSNSGLYTATLDSNASLSGAETQLMQDDLLPPGRLNYVPLEIFERPNGQIIAGLLSTHIDGSSNRTDKAYSILLRPNNSVNEGQTYYSYSDEIYFNEVYDFGMASTSMFVAAYVKTQDSADPDFHSFRANQELVEDHFRIPDTRDGAALAMVSDTDQNLYCLILRWDGDWGIELIPFNKQAEPQVEQRRFITFRYRDRPLPSFGTVMDAAYNPLYDTIMVVFQNHTSLGYDVFIAHIPLS
jgi:hypothetical protein